MLIGSHQKLKNHDLCVTVDGKQLSRVSLVRYLGLHIDENLSWYQHTASVIQIAYSRIHCLNHLRPLPADLLARLYRVFVLLIPAGLLQHSMDTIICATFQAFGEASFEVQ